jgi:hypothetical protein
MEFKYMWEHYFFASSSSCSVICASCYVHDLVMSVSVYETCWF